MRSNKFLVIVLAVVVLSAFSFSIIFSDFSNLANLITGYAVFSDSSQGDFDNGVYVNTTHNGTALVLYGSNLTGTYESRVFDAGDVALWNNLTWQGRESTLTFLFAVDGGGDVYSSIDLMNWTTEAVDYGRTSDTTDMFADSKYLYILSNNNREVWRSIDGGTWSVINDTFADSAILLGEVDNSENLFVVDASGDVYESGDFGISWTNKGDFNGGASDNVRGVGINQGDEIFIIDSNPALFFSNDSGSTWTQITHDYSGAASGLDDLEIDSNDDIYILENKNIWKSTNSGVNWTVINSSFTSYSNDGVKMHIDSGDNFYITDDTGRVFESTDFGVNWEEKSDFNGGASNNPLGLTTFVKESDISFKVMNCSLSSCADGTWQSVDLEQIDFVSQYFKYQILISPLSNSSNPFIESVTLDYDVLGGDVTPPLITINSPLSATLTTATPNLNLTITEENVDVVWISIDDGQNVTYAFSNGTIDFGYLDLVFADDFERYSNGSNGSPVWENLPQFATAVVEDGSYKLFNETPIIDALASINSFNQYNYGGSVKVKVPTGYFGGAYLTQRFGDVNHKYEIALDYDWSSINLNKVVNGTWTSLGALWTGSLPTPVFVSKDEWHLLGFEIMNNNLSAFVDSQHALSVLDSDLNDTGFAIIAFDDNDTHMSYFDDLELHKELSYGSHTLTVYANDSSGNINSTKVTFFVNVSNPLNPPLVKIIYPQSQNYSTNVSSLNYTATDIDLDSCWYSLDNGATNSSINCGTNITGTFSSEGFNTWTLYANDTLGNLNSSSTTFFKDTANPTWITEPQNQSIEEGYFFTYDIEATDNLGIDRYYIDDVVNFSINQTGFISNNSVLQTGDYSLIVSVNDTADNILFKAILISVSPPAGNSPPTINSNNTLVNGSVKLPEMGETFSIQVNLTDAENDSIDYVNFTVTDPDGIKVINNIKGVEFLKNSFSIWNSSEYTVDKYGTWLWSYTLSDGYNLVNQGGSFGVYSEVFIFPEEYIESLEFTNETLYWNLSLYHLSWENYTFNFTSQINQTYFNLTFEKDSASFNKDDYNSTSNLFKNLVTIEVNQSVPVDALYLGHINITRQEDGEVFTVPIEIGINPPTGNGNAFSIISGIKCLSNSCDIDEKLENDESVIFSWKLKNVGSFKLSECIPEVTGFDITGFGSFLQNNFSLNASEETDLELIISNPPINSYYGKLEVICRATQMGFKIWHNQKT